MLYLEFPDDASEARRLGHGDVVGVDQSDSRLSKQDGSASLTTATHTNVLLVTAVVLAPWKLKATLVNSRLISDTPYVVQPDLAHSVCDHVAVHHLAASAAHLSAHHLCVCLGELIVTDRTPLRVVEHFQASPHAFRVKPPAQVIGIYLWTRAACNYLAHLIDQTHVGVRIVFPHLASDANVELMHTGVLTPAREGAVCQIRLVARTVQVSHPYFAMIDVGCLLTTAYNAMPVAHGPAGHICVSLVESVSAYCSPLSLLLDFQPSLNHIWQNLIIGISVCPALALLRTRPAACLFSCPSSSSSDISPSSSHLVFRDNYSCHRIFVVFSSIYAINNDVFAMIAILSLFLALAKLIFPSFTFYASSAKLTATLKRWAKHIYSVPVAVVKGF